MYPSYDVIVIGGGHAGCEAAHAAATLGSKVLLITMNMQTIAQMSCNPAMGGVAKGQIVREIDALGGMSGIITDKSMIQFRMLNRSKGPAMWSPRAQSDRMVFAQEWRDALEANLNVDIWQEMATEIVMDGDKITGVKTGLGVVFNTKSVVLTNGTFLNGLIHIGEKQFGGGRSGEHAAKGLTEQLVALGFESGRMKTGTPPRVDGRSLNWEKMQEQAGDENPEKFSFSDQTTTLTKQRSCFITYTSNEVHDILKTGFDRSPMFNGRIQGLGPRYCPSIEDKINRFAERDRHQIFVEPEGWNTCEMYINGFSTSLPEDVQYKALRKIEGFENAKMFRPGYAIEYDFFPPTQLKPTLETKLIENLYFAGQINGTTGYEEAASQGLMAGINAHNKITEKEPFILKRSEAYIGVLIDDLINKGTDEPYRMFTSRAEYRILLRQDNADIRLTQLGHQIGLASDERFDAVQKKKEQINKTIETLKETSVKVSNANPHLEAKGLPAMNHGLKADKFLKKTKVDMALTMDSAPTLKEEFDGFSDKALEEAEILLKYEAYIEKEEKIAEKLVTMENYKIPDGFDFRAITALSAESREKLSKVAPLTLGQASRISGVTPADVTILMVYLDKQKN
ncbi:tRNA uridine-5-carboxymethylaminomethyl(34) synthesis enzyme MnmG [Flammeovirga agarivorans]|uniref:tRNA uridine 5-carboxymethylaminomethyl modification enzyme MnmG n=1 Tax=Flammeovirga agarivorans TaxID=2726742 RepID=A0A7X8SMC5_9BACT|nr:tRNA uridine-5-carboxymethylaminomethyl(34) synthesis enzyme MnmG [Flammeovirga agarivorans]NLR92782.1 tRNA uridine-5-carboxymethylaminomethyl(34) synthesis enzyme MnmG [Flammeovirga agarivorans]